MIEYTKEELILLESMIQEQSYGLFEYALTLYIEDKPIDLKSGGSFDSFHHFLKMCFSTINTVMYETPFDGLPLLIDTQRPLPKAIIRWRLMIGK